MRRPGLTARVTLLSLVGISIPVFLLGLTLQVIFAVDLNLLPATGRLDPRTLIDLRTNFMLIDPWLMPDWSFGQRLAAFLDALRHLVLPAITLGSVPLAIITRITRAAVIEVSNEDYVRAARAKGPDGAPDPDCVMSCAMPGCRSITIIGLQSGTFLGGAVLTETVFAWNGVGSWVVQAITYREYFVIQSTILIFASCSCW